MTRLIPDLQVLIDEGRLDNRLKVALQRRHFRDSRGQRILRARSNYLNLVEPRPRGIYAFFEPCINVAEGTLALGDQLLRSASLVDRFRFVSEVGLFIVTVGSDIEEKVERFRETDPFAPAILDCIGSEYAESAADAMHKHLEMEKGRRMSRFSPGYGDWDISEQTKLFSIIPGEEIGVRLSETSQMKPEKSVSAMIG